MLLSTHGRNAILKSKLSPRQIAECVLKLSDFYISNPQAPTPWGETFTQVAYQHYYHPLNLLRAKEVVRLGQVHGFWNGISKVADWGCGLGAGSEAVSSSLKSSAKLPLQIDFIESSPIACNLHKAMSPLKGQYLSALNMSGLKQNTQQTLHPNYDLGIFSFSLTEVENPLPLFGQFKKIMMIEPGTHQDGRRLMGYRQKLIDQGWRIVAPCTHHQACPLLTHSKTDWCHHRVEIQRPAELAEIEEFLPFENPTLTFSYLLAESFAVSSDKTTSASEVRLSNPHDSNAPADSHLARAIGDPMIEKGKIRQALCRGPKREFLAWLKKNGDFDFPKRGSLFQLPKHKEVSNEIRPVV